MEPQKHYLVHRDSLLSQLAVQLRLLENTTIGCIEIALYVAQDEGEDAEYVFGLTSFLDMLSNDLYWDDTGNWAEAYLLKVRTI